MRVGCAFPSHLANPIVSSAKTVIDDAQAMRAALRLADASMYITSPNPRVGCVIVRDGEMRGIDTPRQPRRIVLDSALQISPEAKVLTGGGSWIFTTTHDASREAALVAAGAEVIPLPDQGGKVDLQALMHELGSRQINELHVEAGFKLNGSLLRAGMRG